MDIMMPGLEQQPSPAPWLVRRNRVDVPRLIRTALEQNPSAGVDQVVAQLAHWNVQASGAIVAMYLMRWKELSAENCEDRREHNVTKTRVQEHSPVPKEPQWASTI